MCVGSLATEDVLHVAAVRISFARISHKVRMISIILCAKDAIFLVLFLSVTIAKIGFVKIA